MLPTQRTLLSGTVSESSGVGRYPPPSSSNCVPPATWRKRLTSPHRRSQGAKRYCHGQLQPVREHVAELALQHRRPSITRGEGGNAEAGLLMTYGANVLALDRGAAVYVDKILKSTLPADLPFEQPTVFDFVVNLRTAQALGLTIHRTWPRR